MGNLDATLGEISKLEKSANAGEAPPAFSKETIKKVADAAAVYKAALAEIEKEPEAVQKTAAGRAIAVMRASMLGIEGTMSLVWDANELDDTAKGQVQNVITLLSGLMTAPAAKAAASDPKPAAEPAKSDEPKPEEPTDPAVEPTAKSAAEQADGKNTPEGHSEGNGGDPANPEEVAWPKDLNDENFRKNEYTPEKQSWGKDPSFA